MTTRLKAARLTNDSLISKIDDGVGALEAAVAEILGVSIDVDVTEAGFTVDNATGRITKALIRQAAAIPFIPPGSIPPVAGFTVGLEEQNSTNENKVRLGLFWMKNGTKYSPAIGFCPSNTTPDVDADGGPNCFGVLLDDHTLQGRRFGTSLKGLLPFGNGNANTYMNALGQYGSPSQVQQQAFLLKTAVSGNTPNTNFYYDVDELLYWTSEDFDPLAMHAANAAVITIATAGNYAFSTSIRVTPSIDPTTGYLMTQIVLTRSGTPYSIGRSYKPFITGTHRGTPDILDYSVCVDAVYDCQVGDTVAVHNTWENSPLVSALLGTPYAISPSWFSGVRIS